VATLTYVYADQTAVVGPLATVPEPHTYDLCEEHAVRLTVPRGWDVVRHEGEFTLPAPAIDDLLALADAVREAGRMDLPADQLSHRAGGASGGYISSSGGPSSGGSGGLGAGNGYGAPTSGRRGHLRVVRPPV
jgi:hypothetical protein